MKPKQIVVFHKNVLQRRLKTPIRDTIQKLSKEDKHSLAAATLISTILCFPTSTISRVIQALSPSWSTPPLSHNRAEVWGIIVKGNWGLASFNSNFPNGHLRDKFHLVQLMDHIQSGFSMDPALVPISRNVRKLRGMTCRGPLEKSGILGLKNTNSFE